jgi:glycosyltransferase involved in cell wall biosynthesis
MVQTKLESMKFIHFGNDWFAENRTSSHHIAKRIGARYPMLYVEVPGLKKPKASMRDLRKIVEKLRMTFQSPQLVAPHFWRMTLPQMPLRRFALIRGGNRMLSRFLIRRAIRSLDFNAAIAWFHVPHPGFLAKQLGEKLTVFYCVDDYSRLPGVDEIAVQDMDDTLTATADIVFTCNRRLMETHSQHNGNVHLSPHGVDTEMFALSTSPETEIPEEANELRRPVIGWWGVLDPRVDISILEHLAVARPNWTILLIGRVAVDVSALSRLANVVLVGTKAYTDLPRWAKAINVCILPYAQSFWRERSSPLKLQEYLAAGKPIVSTPFPEARMFGSLVQVVADGPGFVCAIEEALATDTPERAALRQQAVRSNTWDATIENVLEKLEAELRARCVT